MYQNILLPTDGSDLSLRAADMGIVLAAKFGAKVYGLHVVPAYPSVAYMTEVVMISESAYDEQSSERAERYLADVAERARKAGVPCETDYIFDDHPSRAIIEAARTHGCDLIVMGSHGRRGIDRLLLGSETQRVLVGCDLPVLVCR